MIVVHMCSASAWPAPAASTSRIVILVLQRDQVSIVNSHRPVASLQIPLPSADAHQLCFDLVLLFLFNMTPTYFRNLSPNRWPAPPSSRICWISFSRPKFSSISSPPLVPTAHRVLFSARLGRRSACYLANHRRCPLSSLRTECTSAVAAAFSVPGCLTAGVFLGLSGM